MNQITPALKYGNWRPSATHNHLLWSSLYLWRHKQEGFSDWWNRIKNWTNIFLQKSIGEWTKLKLDRSKKEKINYRWDKIRGLVARFEWFIFTSFSNSRFAADVIHLCKLSVYHVGAHLGCEISCNYIAISTVPSFKYFALWIFPVEKNSRITR